MASNPGSSTTTLLAADAKPPKSKSAPYYSIHPLWQDVKPIPQADQSGALAPIAYSPRYSEAMSYLRAIMAENEVSERALAMTEDLISMNPAHYTVWIYRMQILKSLWSASKRDSSSGTKIVEVEDVPNEETTSSQSESGVDEDLWNNLQVELKWLDEVSFRNLKNYQIWHHRQGLANLLPTDPTPLQTPTPSASVAPNSTPAKSLSSSTRAILSTFITSEQKFLAQILSLDTKNYHVWSYRQWLCNRFPSFLLPSYVPQSSSIKTIADFYRSQAEVAAMDIMIEEDVRNNSAWSHRYFILFGNHELTYAQSQTPPIVLKKVNEGRLLEKAGILDPSLIQAEIECTKTQIEKAPQNGSPWNYLKGVLRHGHVDITAVKNFCEAFLGPDGDLWMDQWVDVETEDSQTGEKRTERQKLGVQSSHAVEWLSEIYGMNGTEEGKTRSKECLRSLSEKWDIIRRGYWDHRLSKLEEDWGESTK